jgi:hypothetical protein
VVEASSFVVLLTRPEQRDPMALAKALASARKTPLQDQIIAAKNGWGVVAENLSEPAAQNLVKQLRQDSLETVALPSTSLVQVLETVPATKFEPLLSLQPILIAAAGLTITTMTTKTVKEGPSTGQKVLSTAIFLGTGLPIRIGGKERTIEKNQQVSDLVFYVDLMYKDPLRRLRISAANFDYSFLKERKLYQLLGNFKLLLGDLVKRTSEAWTNHGARVLLENKPIQTMGYASLADLERETRWLLTLQTLKI